MQAFVGIPEPDSECMRAGTMCLVFLFKKIFCYVFIFRWPFIMIMITYALLRI